MLYSLYHAVGLDEYKMVSMMQIHSIYDQINIFQYIYVVS